MKNNAVKENICRVLTRVWGVIGLLLVLLGGVTVIGFAAALVIGGEMGGSICLFIHKKLFKGMIVATSTLIVLGWIRMELKGEKALTSSSKG